MLMLKWMLRLMRMRMLVLMGVRMWMNMMLLLLLVLLHLLLNVMLLLHRHSPHLPSALQPLSCLLRYPLEAVLEHGRILPPFCVFLQSLGHFFEALQAPF
jgi:hypothetical protein